jgi:hypothetical protein
LLLPSRRFRSLWLTGGVLLAAVSVAWIILAPSWQAYVYGGLLIACFVWATALSYKSRQLAREQPWTLTADSTGLRTPLWAISWDRVESMSIELRDGGIRALRIETFQPSDVTRPNSTFLAINELMNRAARQPAARILDRMVEMPLEALLADLEAVRSGRR